MAEPQDHAPHGQPDKQTRTEPHGQHDRLDRKRLEQETRIQAFRAGGPGGQHRNKVETAIRLTHVPTGMTVVVSDHRSQLRNRNAAFDRLLARLLERAKRPPKRHKTRPTRASKKRRIEQKKRRSQIKHLRRPV